MRAGGAELVQTLNGMINDLIKENRKLRRQVDSLTARGTSVASGTVERGLRTIQRRVQRALGGSASTTRRRTTRSTAGTSGSATRRRRSTTSKTPSTSTRARTTRTRRSSGTSGASGTAGSS